MSDTEQLFNSDEIVPPSFLTKDYFQDVLRVIENDPKAKLLDMAIKPGSGAGDHYASIVQKITVSYEAKGKVTRGRKLFMKTVPDDGKKQEILSQLPMFVNELRMYSDILPAMEKILKLNGEEKWWPSLLYSSDSPLVLVFNDASADGYEVDPTKCNMDQIQLLIEKIAKYHVLSMVIIERGSFNLQFDCVYASPVIYDLLRPVKNHLPLFGSFVKTWPGFESIGEKIQDRQFADKVIDDLLRTMTTPKSYGFNVLNHGDFHIRNLMFREGANKERELLFLDFQVPILNSPSIDLNTMLQLSSNFEVRERKEEVLYKYHQLLVENLTVYGYKETIPTAIDVQIEMLKASSIGNWQWT